MKEKKKDSQISGLDNYPCSYSQLSFNQDKKNIGVKLRDLWNIQGKNDEFEYPGAQKRCVGWRYRCKRHHYLCDLWSD